MTSKFKLSVTITLLLLGLFKYSPSQAEIQATEADLKAAIITNILVYVDWPPTSSSSDQLNLCYTETNTVTEALIKLNGKPIRTKPLNVVLTTTNFDTCQVIYIGDASLVPKKIIDSLKTNAILITGDSPESIKDGIMLNLEIVNGKAVFDVNLGLIKKVGLQISSKVLKLARKVID